MKHLPLLLCCLMLSFTAIAHADENQSKPPPPLITRSLPAHPRLMITPQIKARVAELIKTDPWAKAFFQRITLGAYAVNSLPLIQRKLVGNKRKRMLGTSYAAMRNIVTLCMSNMFKPDSDLRQRAIDEMLAIAQFEDWHPSHFLDTAEMTFAMGFGYDWLYHDMTDEQRTTIRNAIIELGLKAALTHKGGLSASNNWNQVRHSSLTAGALAIYEDAPELAEQILNQAHDNYKRALEAYDGDGVYPEGPTYWGYGTGFSVLMAACLNSTAGNDWGILQWPGFAQSFDYVVQVTAPTRKLFNFADSSLGPMTMPMHMWAGSMLNRPDFIEQSKISLQGYLSKVDTHHFRLIPFALLWYKPVDQFKQTTPNTCYVGRGDKVQVAILRSDFKDRNASFIGIKGGNIRVNHGHMDIGSFIVESDGVRWCDDLGAEREIYDRKDSWGTQQNSHRWTFFRVNNFSHNTLTLGGKIQQVNGMNPVIASAKTNAMQCAVLDMSSAYKGQAAQVHRGIALLADKSMIVQDDYAGLVPSEKLLWNMTTKARIKLSDDGTIANLEYGKRTLHVIILSPAAATFTIRDAKPPLEIENQNKGYQRLTLNLPAPVSDGLLTVRFIPGSVKQPATFKVKPVDQWCVSKQ